MATQFRRNPFGSELLIVGGNPRKRRKHRKSSRRRKHNRGRRSRRRNRGGSYIAFSKSMWRKHRKHLMALPFKQRAKWISKQYKK